MRLTMVINMFPGVLSMIAVYFIMKSIGLTESHIGMIVVYSAGSGLGYLIVKGYMDTIPASLREAAKLEGASEFDVFMQIIFPLCRPIVVYQIIASFLIPWGDFVFAKLMLGHDVKNYTIAIGLYGMLSKENLPRYFSQFCAGGILISIPISILFVIPVLVSVRVSSRKCSSRSSRKPLTENTMTEPVWDSISASTWWTFWTAP